ncbi:tetratricopeptide repeat protein [Aestuariivita boseongensis]|uniref:tetratricopeptide repeat protein n=1 Tax=Aestuariivita boseongensis TaxID=1470562 RepID=UPI000681170D|nr:tetratricopeptide repeat protein [Aestuariivita boseongensis]
MRLAAVFCLTLLPTVGFAAGSDTPVGKPVTTPTTQTCKGVQVWDPATQKCVNPRGSSLDQDLLGEAVRELAYAGRNEDAQGVLRAMADQDSDLVLTYWGFTHRKMGNLDQAKMFYDRALEKNPDNILARSYLGQGLVSEGKVEEARAQLDEIRARGGAGGWAEQSLVEAIETGKTSNY